MTIKYSLAILAALLANQVYAQTSSNNIATNEKATATLAAKCSIMAQNVNFGQVILPVTSQSSTSQMTIQCTKGSTYTIGLAYGGIYGTGSSASAASSQVTFAAASAYPGSTDSTYNANVASLRQWRVWNPAGDKLTIRAIQYYEYNAAGTQIGVVAINATDGNPSALPLGATNSSGTFVFGGYSYGILVGAAKGDTIGYSIQVPNNPSQVWNNGNYTYSSTGNGSNQSIPVVVTLQSGHGVSYPTADTYLDTVTATITY